MFPLLCEMVWAGEIIVGKNLKKRNESQTDEGMQKTEREEGKIILALFIPVGWLVEKILEANKKDKKVNLKFPLPQS